MTPVVVVHERDRELNGGFLEIVRAGGKVHQAPSYRINHLFDYAARNTPGSLKEALNAIDPDVEFLVICDPDMIFVRRPVFGHTLSGDFYSYIDFNQPPVQDAAARLGLAASEELQREEVRCGVPHVIPVKVAGAFADAWLRAIDAFSYDLWERSMYAFGFAATALNLSIDLTHFNDHNGWHHEPVRADIIHYCYGNEEWTKRAFTTEEQIANVWNSKATAARGSILREILDQIIGARSFYHRFEI